MASARDYISSQEYDEALRRFYNGLDYTEHIKYKNSILDRMEYKADVIKEFLVEGEQYTSLFKGYVITSYGRVFNLRFKRFLKPKFYNSNIYIFCGYNTYRLEGTFKKMGWSYDKADILERYTNMNWSRKIMDNCKYAHEVQ